MATPTPRRSPPPKRQIEVVDPRWILKALLLVVLAAAICAYLALCLLVYQGGWQLLLRPVAKVDATPSVPFQAIRFDASASGTPRLTGWWIPADSGPFVAPARTILYLHDGSGSLSSDVRELALLHLAKVNIFAIDYRGFGQSEGPHPTEARMLEDANAALDYLLNTRHIASAEIVPYGAGLGAVIAARLANNHSDLPAIIIYNPDPESFARAISGQSRFLPMQMLVQEHFDIAAALAASARPKLLLVDGPFEFNDDRVRANQRLFRSVPDPKTTVTFDSKIVYPGKGFHPPYFQPTPPEAYTNSITRFLDEYVPQ